VRGPENTGRFPTTVAREITARFAVVIATDDDNRDM